MTLKPEAKKLELLEQIIEDPVSGLTIQFIKRNDGGCAIKIWGDLPYGNRDLGFDENGEFSDAGTNVNNCPRPNWIKEIK